MNVFVLTALTMCAFAANSLLNRAGLAGGGIGPAGFALIRVAAGAGVLGVLLTVRGRALPRPPRPNWGAVVALSTYILGFSFAYVSLDAGLGALILFAGVQITMFAGAVAGGDRFPIRRWLGMGLSLIGLAYLVWPSDSARISGGAIFLMALAAMGWGIYSLIGRRNADPLAATAWNFAYSLPLAAVVALVLMPTEPVGGEGIALALISGGVTSGLGYALWYRLLPGLGATTAALAQLTVPVIALAAAVLLLGEALTLRAVLACALICGGIALGLVRLPGR